MRRTLLIAAMLVMSHSALMAQGGHLGIFGDAEATDCYPMDDFEGILRFYLVMIEAPGVRGTEFTVVPGGGFVGTFLGDELGTDANVSVGNSPTGKAVAFPDCYSGTVHVLTISYYCHGQSAACSYLEVLPYKQEAEINVADCDYQLSGITGGRTYVNHDGTCACEAPGFETSPVERSTWGGVKAIYAAH